MLLKGSFQFYNNLEYFLNSYISFHQTGFQFLTQTAKNSSRKFSLGHFFQRHLTIHDGWCRKSWRINCSVYRRDWSRYWQGKILFGSCRMESWCKLILYHNKPRENWVLRHTLNLPIPKGCKSQVIVIVRSLWTENSKLDLFAGSFLPPLTRVHRLLVIDIHIWVCHWDLIILLLMCEFIKRM